MWSPMRTDRGAEQQQSGAFWIRPIVNFNVLLLFQFPMSTFICLCHCLQLSVCHLLTPYHPLCLCLCHHGSTRDIFALFMDEFPPLSPQWATWQIQHAKQIANMHIWIHLNPYEGTLSKFHLEYAVREYICISTERDKSLKQSNLICDNVFKHSRMKY